LAQRADAQAKPILRVSKLAKRFKALQVLSGIDLDVSRGEVLCLMGPSGSGKTTLLRCLNLLELPTSGIVEVGDIRCGGDESAWIRPPREAALLRRKFGMVFQQFNLWVHKTVLENIIEAPMLVLKLPREAAEAKALALLKQVWLVDKVKEYPSRLSGGQQQRVAIARALAMDPEIMLFDEPTSALDPELVGEVLRVMRELAAQDMTMVVVSHEVNFVKSAADRVIVMQDGHIVEEGVPQAIFSQPRDPKTRQFLQRALMKEWI
jgi:ABC-type polar amino acid transport system ATPase subunit